MDYGDERKQVLILFAGAASTAAFVGALLGFLAAGPQGAGTWAGYGAVLSLPVVLAIWKLTKHSADVTGNVFFSVQGGKAAARGYSIERAMARDGRGAEALQRLWAYHEEQADGAVALWELLEVSRRHALKDPLVARAAQRLLRQPGMTDLDRRRLQEVLAEATAEPKFED